MAKSALGFMLRPCLHSLLRSGAAVMVPPRASRKTTQVLSLPWTRCLSSSVTLRHKHIDPPKPGEEIKVTFLLQNGTRTTIDAPAGASILDVAHENDVELEGACEGSVACSTCHIVVEPSYYEKLPEPDDEENDMLDLAFGLEETSRLGCQVILDKSLDGIVVKLPSATRNIQHQRPGQ